MLDLLVARALARGLPAVELHVKSILMDLFTWTRGEYTFVIKELDERDRVATLNMTTENLILEGIRNTHSWQQVIRALGDVESVFTPAGLLPAATMGLDKARSTVPSFILADGPVVLSEIDNDPALAETPWKLRGYGQSTAPGQLWLEDQFLF